MLGGLKATVHICSCAREPKWTTRAVETVHRPALEVWLGPQRLEAQVLDLHCSVQSIGLDGRMHQEQDHGILDIEDLNWDHYATDATLWATPQ